MRYTTLIDPAALAAAPSQPQVVIADCRFDLKDPAAGERAYEASHIPGAIYVHLDRDLSAAKTGTNGRHPLPAPATAAGRFGHLGISNDTQVIAYDQDSGMYASRLWWMLRWLGHDRVAVLDGGFARWVADGRPTVAGRHTLPPVQFVGAPRPEMLVSVSELPQLTTSGFHLIDARAPERYRGDVEPIDRVAGHIPGARNHFFQSNLDEKGLFRAPADLARQFGVTLAGAPADRAVCYCGSGVTACHDLLAMEHAGLKGAKLYAGSWSEWSADSERPVEKG